MSVLTVYPVSALGPSISWAFSPCMDAGGIVTTPPPVQFTVTDPNLAGNGIADTINVKVTSTSDPTGIVLKLAETGDTGTFTNTNLIFTSGNQEYHTSDTEKVGINDPSLVTNPNVIETIDSSLLSSDGIQIFSTSDTTGIFLKLTETGPGTGIFTDTFKFTTGPSVNDKALHVAAGDVVTILRIDGLFDQIENQLIIPNPNQSMGALPTHLGDTVSAIYDGVTSSVPIVCGFGPGGGGGGLIIPSLVLDSILALGNYGVVHPPSIGNDYRNPYGGGIMINGKSFDIENYATKIPQQVLDIGKPANFAFKIHDERGAYTVSHVGMYFHFKGDPLVSNADTWISWDKYKGLVTYDPNKIFSKTSGNATINGSYLDVTFTITPQKPMPDSSLIMRMWDDKLATGDVPIWGAIVIVDPNTPIPVKKIPTDQYDDYVILEQILDKDGYNIPLLLNKLHSLPEIYRSLDINWVYDKGVDKLTLVESDKSGVVLGTIVTSLTKKVSQPTITDHNFFNFTTQQLNRQDVGQEDTAKLVEEQKAMKLLESLYMIRQNNFVNLK